MKEGCEEDSFLPSSLPPFLPTFLLRGNGEERVNGLFWRLIPLEGKEGREGKEVQGRKTKEGTKEGRPSEGNKYEIEGMTKGGKVGKRTSTRISCSTKCLSLLPPFLPSFLPHCVEGTYIYIYIYINIHTSTGMSCSTNFSPEGLRMRTRVVAKTNSTRAEAGYIVPPPPAASSDEFRESGGEGIVVPASSEAFREMDDKMPSTEEGGSSSLSFAK